VLVVVVQVMALAVAAFGPAVEPVAASVVLSQLEPVRTILLLVSDLSTTP